MSPAINQNRTIDVPAKPTAEASKEFEQTLLAVIADHPDLILLDCAALQRVISSHINLLWTANTLCREAGIELRLLNPSPGLFRILSILDLLHAFSFNEMENFPEGQSDKGILSISLPKSYSEEVSAEMDAINKAIARFVSFLTYIGAGTTTMHELRTIYYEIATNIRQHSGLTVSDKFRVDINADFDQIIMTFIDAGRTFNAAVAGKHVDANIAAKTRKRRGFGLAMIHRLANRLEYQPNNDKGNILTVYKKWCK